MKAWELHRLYRTELYAVSIFARAQAGLAPFRESQFGNTETAKVNFSQGLKNSILLNRELTLEHNNKC